MSHLIFYKKKDQFIINCMTLVKVHKQRLQNMRDNRYSILLEEVHAFCEKNSIIVPNMSKIFIICEKLMRYA